MFNRKSSYALNKKDPNAIVYMDANEVIVRLTREDFASEKEFLKWKALSDEDYHASEKEAHVYANHTLALDELSEEAASIPAVDVCMEQAHDRAEAIHRSVRKVTQIRKHLTDTQFRRVWIHRMRSGRTMSFTFRREVYYPAQPKRKSRLSVSGLSALSNWQTQICCALCGTFRSCTIFPICRKCGPTLRKPTPAH